MKKFITTLLMVLALAAPVWAQVPERSRIVVPSSTSSSWFRAGSTPTDCSAPQFSFTGDTDTGVSYGGVNYFKLCSGGVPIAQIDDNPAFQVLASGGLWITTGGFSTKLLSDAANTLAQRNGTNAQTFNLYKTYTSATSYERLSLGSDGTQFYIDAQKGSGGGSYRPLTFVVGGVLPWQITTSGHLVAPTDNTYDIGASGATRPRTLYLGGSLVAGTGTIGWTGSTIFTNVSDGVFRVSNNAGTGFTRLILGTNDASGASLVKNSTGIDIRNGDGTSLSALTAGSMVSNSTVRAVDATITSGSGTGVTVATSGTLARQVYKVTIDRTAFVCNATTCDVTIGTLPTKTNLLGFIGDLTTTFACTATCTTSTLSMTVGSSAGGTDILLSFDADAAVATKGGADADLGSSLARASAVQGGKFINFSSTVPISVRLTSGTGNIGNGSATNLSQGSITFYLVTERLP